MSVIEMYARRPLTARELAHMRTYPGFLSMSESAQIYTFWLKDTGANHKVALMEHLIEFRPNKWQYGDLATGTVAAKH
jgi:hypothetical protein